MRLPPLKELSLNEIAKDLTGLALFDQDDMFFCIYEPHPELREAVEQQDFHHPGQAHIKGVLATSPPPSGRGLEVFSIFTQQGYGPILYKVAMTFAKEEGLMPKITPAAKKVWQEFYSGVGSKDVITKRLKPVHQEEYLNYKYIIKAPLNLSTAQAMHRKFVGNDPDGTFEDNLLGYADTLRMDKMKSVYGNK
jgi:hypothetical protein